VLKEQFVNILDGFLNGSDLSTITMGKKINEQRVSTVMEKYFPVTP
jgi:hypothetical protein